LPATPDVALSVELSMAENETPTGADGAAGADAGQQQQTPPRLSILTQYVKDLSFENPRAPNAMQSGQRPEIQINVDTRGRPVEGDRYEAELQINVNAKSDGETVFVCELTYGGLFAIANMPDNAVQPVLMIECPRLLFPFARRVIADATRDGGFPPLMIDPIDFLGLYRQRLQQQQQQQQNDAGGEEAPAGNA
jgi:preprotein translocase subunit SecB